MECGLLRAERVSGVDVVQEVRPSSDYSRHRIDHIGVPSVKRHSIAMSGPDVALLSQPGHKYVAAARPLKRAVEKNTMRGPLNGPP